MPRSGLKSLTVALTAIAVTLVGVSFTLSCSKQASYFDTPAPRAVGLTPTEVFIAAQLWASASPDRFTLTVLPTGSMEPFVNEHSVILCVRYTGQPLSRGAVIFFDRGDVPNVLHVLADQNDTHVIVSGTHNSRTDGWHPKSSIKGFMVGQLYLP